MTKRTLGLWKWALAGISVATFTGISGDVGAQAPTLRATVDQAGDFKIIGNSLAHDCGVPSNTPAPVVGTVPDPANCGGNTIDTAADVFWQSDDDNNTATASIAHLPTDAQSTAVLDLPPGATVTHAFLYWAGEVDGDQGTQMVMVDDTITFDRPDGAGGTVFTSQITADQVYSRAVMTNSDLSAPYDFYQQAVADVTTLVNTHGEGAYRLGGFNLHDIFGEAQEVSFASWTLVVFYNDGGSTPRNLTLFDGFTYVDDVSGSAQATLTGFLVPSSGFDAKLGVIAYEGDNTHNGDQLLFGTGTLNPATDALSNALNPENNFFNSTHTFLGATAPITGDLPQLDGGPETMGNVDFDVVNITNRLAVDQTTANIEATSTFDVYFLGAFVTSIATLEPNLSTSEKTVTDVNGGALLPGDELEYTISVVNNGNDNAVDTVLTDVLPTGVTFVPGSILIESGPNMGAKTDAAADDQGEYDGGSRTVTVRLGDGAGATLGGTLDIGETTVVKFKVTVDAGTTGTIANQGEITYAGEQGAPQATVVTDGNADDVGTPTTDIDVNECEDDVDCGGADNGQVCDSDQDYICVPGCRGLADSGCPTGDMCTSNDATIGDCVPDAGTGSGGAGGSGTGTGTGTGGSGASTGAGMGGGMSGVGGSTGTGSGANSGTDDDGGNIDEDGSCGCKVPGKSDDNPWRAATLLGLLGVAAMRRRRG